MKVLSIKEPFASLIKDGKKTIETRSWKTNYRGEIFIHASKTKQKLDDRIRKLNDMISPNPGYILCKGKLTDCIYMDEEFISKIKQEDEYIYGHYVIGRYAWMIEDVTPIKPIFAKGKLGIWNYEVKEGIENE